MAIQKFKVKNGIDLSNQSINNLADPVNATDAVNKQYLENQLSLIGPNTVVSVSDDPPVSPVDNQLWIDSNTMDMYLRYNDGTSSSWIQVNGGGSDNFISVYANIASLPLANTTVTPSVCYVQAISKYLFNDGVNWVEYQVAATYAGG